MSAPPHVALLVNTAISYQRDALRGIARHVRGARPWSFYVEQERRERYPELRRWRGDGVIVAAHSPRVVRDLERLGVPVVDISSVVRSEGFTLVGGDNRGAGRRAAEHLLERGHRRFAFCGFAHSARTGFSRGRECGFVGRVEEAGFRCEVFKTRRTTARDWAALLGELSAWIRSLEKPVGIMACNDVRARHVLEACREAGVHVPEEAAVLGVDNDAMMCEFCSPPLSSVDLGAERIGYRAAEVLDGLMAGDPAPPSPILVEAGEVVCRQSTDVLAIEDEHTARAVRFIREHACEGINVAEVLARVPLNRRALERRFRRILGRSPHEEIHHVRIGRARELLAATELTTEEVAERCGFTYVQYMRRVFLKSTGMTPGQYRRASRRG